MFVNEYVRYLKSKFNILLTILATIPVIISYYFSMQDKVEMQNELALASPDINLEVTKSLVKGFDGFAFLFRFLFSFDYYIIFILILLIGFGTILGTVVINHKKSGYGNMIQTRMPYKSYLKNIIGAQLAYVITFLIFYFICLITVTLLIFPVNSSYPSSINLNMTDTSWVSCALTMVVHILQLIIFMVLIVSVTSLSDVFITNKYILQCLPLMFYFVPLILGSTLGNISSLAARVTKYIISESYLLSIYSFYNTSQNKSITILELLVLPIILIVIICSLYYLNVKKYERNYLC